MKKGNYTNDHLDALGAELLESGSLHSREIEEIVSSPLLFSSVKARIRSLDSNAVASQSATAVSRFAGWKLTAASCVMAVFLTAFIGIVIFRENEPMPRAASEIAPPVNDETPNLTQAFDIPAEKIVQRVRAKRRPMVDRTAPKRKTKKRLPQPRPPETKEIETFYALTYIADAEAIARDSQVVRIELSRASLYALGVNVPLENDPDVIKTDLLISSNGVASAIRLVD